MNEDLIILNFHSFQKSSFDKKINHMIHPIFNFIYFKAWTEKLHLEIFRLKLIQQEFPHDQKEKE
jgi:hypothetical protein